MTHEENLPVAENTALEGAFEDFAGFDAFEDATAPAEEDVRGSVDEGAVGEAESAAEGEKEGAGGGGTGEVKEVSETPGEGERAEAAKVERKAVAEAAPEKQPSAREAQPAAEDATGGLGKLHEVLAANGEKFVEHLAGGMFRVPSDVAEKFEDPALADFVAQRDAQLYVSVMRSMSQILDKALPQMVQQMQSQGKHVERQERAFFKRHPQLAKEEFQPQLAALLSGIRRAEPNLKGTALMDKLATVAGAYLGLNAPTGVGNGNGAAGVTKAPPFTPAGKSAGGGAPRTPAGSKTVAEDPLADLNRMLQDL